MTTVGHGHGDRPAGSVRPETLLLALLGHKVLGRHRAIAVGNLIAVLTQLGVCEPAIRATVSRMVGRGLLHTVRRGRKSYVGLTPDAVQVLSDGARRIEADVVDRAWDGRWTLLTFSVPETRRADRQALRSRLGWAGFGPLRSGLWISTSPADISDTLTGLNLLDCAEMFRAETLLWTDPAKIAAEAWDLGVIADGYRAFIRRWTRHGPDELDALARRTLLDAEWLLLIRGDPRLPLVLLPADWPGIHAQELFRSMRDQLAPPAAELADELFDTIPDPAATSLETLILAR